MTLESTQYPYALTVAAERILQPFRAARATWDGSSRVMRGSPTVDELFLSGGALFVVGTEWAGDHLLLAQRFVELQEQNFGCSQAKNQRDVTIAGSPALAFTVDSCGAADEAFARVAVVHDGVGLIAFGETSAGRENDSLDKLLADLAGLSWRSR